MLKSKSKLEAERRKKDKAKALRPLIPQMKKDFKKKMAGMAEQAAQVKDEKFRTVLLNLIKSCLRGLGEYRDWDELFEFADSSTDTLRAGLAIGLYGHWDPRTQKVFDAAEGRAMDRAHRRHLGMA